MSVCVSYMVCACIATASSIHIGRCFLSKCHGVHIIHVNLNIYAFLFLQTWLDPAKEIKKQVHGKWIELIFFLFVLFSFPL